MENMLANSKPRFFYSANSGINLDEYANTNKEEFLKEFPQFKDVDFDDIGTYLLKDTTERKELQAKIIEKRLAEGSFSGVDNNGKKGEKYNGVYFKLGTTPNVFVKHGAKQVEMIMYSDVVAKVTGMKGDDAHIIALDEIAKLPSQLNDPILLFKGSVPNSFIAITELVNKQGHDVVVAVHINRINGRSAVTKIASLYSKTNDYGQNRIVAFVNNQINNGNLLDASAKKAPKWFTTRGLQLPKVVQTIIDANNSITQNSDLSTVSSNKLKIYITKKKHHSSLMLKALMRRLKTRLRMLPKNSNTRHHTSFIKVG